MPRFSLRRSLALQLLVGAMLAFAVLAVYSTLAPWLGAWRACPPALAVLAAGALAALRRQRRQAAFLEIGADSLSAWSHDGVRLAAGRIAGASQCGGWLLALVVETGARRTTLLIAADSVSRETFRLLAVRARSAAGH
ncbi:protein YgfX [Paraburkholderia sp. J41]|uniref:protein YgfX n=1 Tax=Paraburkholderia sp. J41 TaxID=2805433 RepID=UPI002AC36910|nr:protein YgfX [Paraburkholderia sp. J41]